MKTHMRIVAAALGVLTLSIVAPAAAQTEAMKAHIPFAFTAGKAVLPAGTYTVSRNDTSVGVLTIRGSSQSALMLGKLAGPNAASGECKLVFNRYGRQYFLRRVLFRGNDGYALPETKAERTWAERATRSAARIELVTVTAAMQ